MGGTQKTQVFQQAESRGFAASIGGSTAIALRWPCMHDNILPATQAIKKYRYINHCPGEKKKQQKSVKLC